MANKPLVSGLLSHEPETFQLPDRLTDVLTVAVIPFMAYSLVYAYSLGGLLFFNAPPIMPAITPFDVLLTVLASIPAALVVARVLRLRNRMASTKGPAAKALARLLLAGTCLYWFAILVRVNRRVSMVLLYLVVSYVVLLYVAPLAWARRSGYRNAFMAWQAQLSRFSLFDWGSRLVGPVVFHVIIVWLALVLIVGTLGYRFAQDQSIYWVIPEHKWAILAFRGDKALVAPYDAETRTILEEFMLVTIESSTSNPITIKLIAIGPLHRASSLPTPPQPR